MTVSDTALLQHELSSLAAQAAIISELIIRMRAQLKYCNNIDDATKAQIDDSLRTLSAESLTLGAVTNRGLLSLLY